MSLPEAGTPPALFGPEIAGDAQTPYPEERRLATVLFALRLANWAIAIYAGLFGAGLWFVAGLTIWQALAVLRRRRPAAPWERRPVEDQPAAPGD